MTEQNPYAGSTIPDRPRAGERIDTPDSPYQRPTEYRDAQHPDGPGLLGYGADVTVFEPDGSCATGIIREVGAGYLALASDGGRLADLVVFTGPGVTVKRHRPDEDHPALRS